MCHLNLVSALVSDDDVVRDALGVEGVGHPHRQRQGPGLRARVTHLGYKIQFLFLLFSDKKKEKYKSANIQQINLCLHLVLDFWPLAMHCN